MITFEQLRDAVIEYETEFIHSTMIEDNNDAESIIEEVSNMVTELSDAVEMDDIIAYYCNEGFQLEEAYENILKVLMAKAAIVYSINKN